MFEGRTVVPRQPRRPSRASTKSVGGGSELMMQVSELVIHIPGLNMCSRVAPAPQWHPIASWISRRVELDSICSHQTLAPPQWPSEAREKVSTPRTTPRRPGARHHVLPNSPPDRAAARAPDERPRPRTPLPLHERPQAQAETMAGRPAEVPHLQQARHGLR